MLRTGTAILCFASSFLIVLIAKAEDQPIVAEAKIEEKANPEKPKESTPKKPMPDTGLTWVFSKPAGIEFTKSEVTVAQYRACVEAGKCSVPKSKDAEENCNWGYSDRDNHPVNCVDWNQATAFCAWAGGRLPSEEEWYAEASNKGTRQYPWGDQKATCDYAVMDFGGGGPTGWGCGKGSTWPVCSKEKGNSVSGLCDMSGNAWEWTSSLNDKEGVVRGGSWNLDYSEGFRASLRYWFAPPGRYADFGFRCGRSAKPQHGTTRSGAAEPAGIK